LHDLLEEAGITDTDYVYGRIEVPEELALDYFGAVTIEGAHNIALGAGLNPYSVDLGGGNIVQQFDHAWLETTIDGVDYVLDPAWKFKNLPENFDTSRLDWVDCPSDGSKTLAFRRPL